MSAGPPDHSVKILFRNDKVVISRVDIAPGGTVPRHPHPHGFAVLPQAEGHIKKTIYRGMVVEKVEEISLQPGAPYWVDGLAPGLESEILNLGDVPVLFTKFQVLAA